MIFLCSISSGTGVFLGKERLEHSRKLMGSTLEKLSVSLGHTEGLSFVLLFGLIRFSSLDLYRLIGAKAFWLLIFWVLGGLRFRCI